MFAMLILFMGRNWTRIECYLRNKPSFPKAEMATVIYLKFH